MDNITNSASVALPEVSRFVDLSTLAGLKAKYGDATRQQPATPSARTTVNGSSMLANLPHVQFGTGAQQPANEPAQADPTPCAAEFEPVDEGPAQTAQQLSVAATLAEWGGEHERAAELRAKAEDAPENVVDIETMATIDYKLEQAMQWMADRYVILLGESVKVYDIRTGNSLGAHAFVNQSIGNEGGLPGLRKPTDKARKAWADQRAKGHAHRASFVVETEPASAGAMFLTWTKARRAQTIVNVPAQGGRAAEFDPETQVFNRFHYVWENRPIKPTNEVVLKRTTPHDPRIKPLLDHMLYLAGGDENAVCLFVYYLAWVYQHPGDKIPWAPLIFTRQLRMGKSTLVYLLRDVFGGRSSGLVGESSGPQLKKALEGQFTESFDRGLLKFVHEIPPLNDPIVLDELKSLISESSGESRHMRTGAVQTERRLQFIFTTNNADALPQIASLGRFLVLGTEAGRRPHEQYQQFFAWAGDKEHTGPGAQALCDVLHEMEFPDWWDHNAPPPLTDCARQMDEESIRDDALFVRSLIDGRKPPFERDFNGGTAEDNLKTVNVIIKQYENCNPATMPPAWLNKLDTQRLGRIFRELGFRKLSQKVDGNNPPWCWRNVELWGLHNAEKMRQHLKDGSRPFKEP